MVSTLEAPLTTESESSPPEESKTPPLEMNDGDNARASMPFSGDVVMSATKHYPDQHRDAVRWLFYHCVEEGLRLQEVCKQLKRDDSTISRVMTGKYRNPAGELVDLSNIVRDIDKYRKAWEAGQIRSEFRYIQTPVIGTNIWKLCDFTAEMATIGFVWGESQTGKSENFKGWHRAHNHGRSKYCKLKPASGQLMMLRQLAVSCAISPKVAYDKLLDRIIRSLDKSNLIIIDEIHQVTTTYHARSKINCLELLRYIRDESGCGMVLCGTNTFRDELQEGRDKKLLEQLTKRAPAVYQCPDATPRKDVDAIIKGWGLPPIEDDLIAVERTRKQEDILLADVIEELCVLQGLEILLTYVKSGVKFAAKEKRAFNWRDFIHAYRVMAQLAQPKGRK